MKLYKSRTPWVFLALTLTGALTMGYFFLMTPFVSANREPAAAREDLSCTCDVRGQQFTDVSFETPAECGADRNYLRGPLEAFRKLDSKSVYIGTRAQPAGHMPRKCFLFAMKHTFPPSFRARLFGECGIKTPTPEDPTDFTRTNWKPCVTEDLVNTVYNSYVDASDCFDVPKKFALGKFMNESGVIPNLVAANNDAGLAQFSTGGMKILQNEYPEWSKKILNSTKQSCRNLLAFPGAMPKSAAEIVAKNELKCQVIGIPSNPVKNFIFYGVYYHITRRDTVNMFNRKTSIDRATGQPDPTFRTTAKLMEEAKIADYDVERLLDILSIMSYNTGPKAVIYFREWLQYRIAKFPTVPVRKTDLSMVIKPDPWAGFDTASKEELAARYDRNGTRAMSFWEWLVVNKNKFRYAAFVKFYSNRLDTSFGAGVCTEPNFLEM